MNSLLITDELERDIKSTIEVFTKRGMSLYQALKLYLSSRFDMQYFKLDLEDEILLSVWDSCNLEPFEEEGLTYYHNERDSIIQNLMDENKSKGYLYNEIYRLRNSGYLLTEIKVRNHKRVTLLSLSDRGLEVIRVMLNQIKNAYEKPLTQSQQ